MLSTIDLYYDIEYFNISPPNELSDHCLLSAGIHNNLNNVTCSEEEHNILPGKFIWSDEIKERYTLALVDDESIQKIMDLNEKLQYPSLNINNLVNELSSLYKNAAEKTLVFKSFAKKGKKRKPKKIKPKNQWMSYDCLQLRQEVKYLSRKLYKDPNNCALRQGMS